jgi:AraC family transcriptional regulator
MPPSAEKHAAPNPYVARVNRVVDHIGAHLAEPMELATLARIANFSPWHFHRLFQAVSGETLADCVRRLRLEEAAHRLLLKPRVSALSIAIDTGFGSAEVFSRAFKSYFGMTPTAWRDGGAATWHEARRIDLRKIHQDLSKQHQEASASSGHDGGHWPTGQQPASEGTSMQIEIRTIPPMRLAYMRHTGPYGHPGIGQMWERFTKWVRARGINPPRGEMYGIAHDSPDVTPPEKCRYDACIEVSNAFELSGDDRNRLGISDFAGGQFACGPFRGTGSTIHAAWMHMYGSWLPASGYQPADRPPFELYGCDFKVDEKTGEWSCLLCLPIQPL